MLAMLVHIIRNSDSSLQSSNNILLVGGQAFFRIIIISFL